MCTLRVEQKMHMNEFDFLCRKSGRMFMPPCYSPESKLEQKMPTHCRVNVTYPICFSSSMLAALIKMTVAPAAELFCLAIKK
jgi:hypothetical protein